LATRKMGNLAKPTVTIKIEGSSFYLKSESTFRNIETSCTIGQEFDEESPDGRKCKVKTSFKLGLNLKSLDLLHLLENAFDRKRISTNPSPNPSSNPNPKTQ